MYSKFNYIPTKNFYIDRINKYGTEGSKLYNNLEKESKKCLDKFIKENDRVDGSALKEQWFSVSHKDIFISHSHEDLSKVKAFAGWIEKTFNLTCFIDSCVWGYCDDLLKEIDDKYCKKNTSTYSYELRNNTTSHVHMMLSIALSEMIDNCECIIFFNTPSSVSLNQNLEEISNSKEIFTPSPWIYHELAMTNMIRQTTPKRKFAKVQKQRIVAESFSYNPDYDVTKFLLDMTNLSESDLDRWEMCYTKNVNNNSSINALDILYNIKKE